MPENPLYPDYLALLQEVGPALAGRDPQAAAMLGRTSFDPDVDRLLEGIAFISSKVDEKRQAGLSEVCQLLMDVLFPNYLMPLPACAIVQLDSQADEPPKRIARGTPFFSKAVDGTRCQFVSGHEVQVDGLALEGVNWRRSGSASELSLTFVGGPWLAERPPVDRIRLFLHGEPLLTRTLFRGLLAYREEIQLYDGQGTPCDASRIRLRPVGYREDEALLAYPPGCFEGFRLLQEYFLLPEKLLFIDLENVWSSLRAHGVVVGVRFEIRFRLRIETDLLPTQDHIRLACVPVANLFEHSADPMTRDQARIDYRVKAAGPHLHHDICRVTGVALHGQDGFSEVPLLAELQSPTEETRFAQIRRAGFGGEVETYLSLYDDSCKPEDQTIVVDLLCSNGKLPTALGLGDIDEVGGVAISGRRCRNLTRPTPPVGLPLDEDLRRRLVLHLGLALRDLTERDALRTAVLLYCPQLGEREGAARAADALTSAITSASGSDTQVNDRGVTLLGRETRIELDPSRFSVKAESYLLGCVLSEYIALQSPINRFSQLALRHIDTGETFQWPTRIGTRELTTRSTG